MHGNMQLYKLTLRVQKQIVYTTRPLSILVCIKLSTVFGRHRSVSVDNRLELQPQLWLLCHPQKTLSHLDYNGAHSVLNIHGIRLICH